MAKEADVKRHIMGAMMVGLGLIAPVSAQDRSQDSPAFTACLAKAQTTVDIVTCQTEEMKVQDRALNAAYKKAMAALPADQQAKLRLAQRAWLDFRKLDCDVFYGKETGTIASLEAGGCMITHTKRRVADLEAFTAQR